MRIITSKGEFQLPPQFSAEITAFNQVFNQAGEQSIPITLPGTPHNMALLRFPQRIDSYYKPLHSLPVDVVDDVFMRAARMAVHHADEHDGISCTLYFSEAAFYALIDDMSMKDIPLEVIDGVGATHADKVRHLIDMLKSEYQNQQSPHYAVFPVQTAHSITKEFHYKETIPLPPNTIYIGEGPYQPKVKDINYTETANLVLNGFKSDHLYPLGQPGAPTDVTLLFAGEYPQKFKSGNTAIDIRPGYGITPFVDIVYFIRRMFERLHYSFDTKPIADFFHYPQRKVVMLNNVADAIYDGRLQLSQLVPDLSLKEFLKKMSVYLSGVFHIDETRRTVHFRFYADIFAHRPQTDLTPYLSSPLKIESADFSYIELTNPIAPDKPLRANRSYIEAPFPEEKQYIMTAHAQGQTAMQQADFHFSLLAVDNIIHLNSTEVKNTEVHQESPRDTSKQLILAAVSKGVWEHGNVFQNAGEPIVARYKYRRASPYIYPILSLPPIDYLRTLYYPYIEWKSHSNIRVACTMHLPPELLYSLDLSHSYIIDGQPFFIDKIEYALPYDAVQKVHLLTVRKYTDRQEQ